VLARSAASAAGRGLGLSLSVLAARRRARAKVDPEPDAQSDNTSLNALPAAEYDAPGDELLQMSWGWLFGFRFAKIELTTPGISDADLPGGLLHVGSTGCSNQSGADAGMDFEKPPAIACLKQNRNKVRLSGYKLGESVIVADVAALFAQTDLSVTSDCHSSGDACPALFTNIGVNFADGKPLSSQTFYKLE
jgi:hypothetical protein